ncbi:MAG TPA: mechanosensitive ion channel domain-containing protein [Candidatus Acidoferrales bacterium]|nr:mechanosensitive ion channel domain-containing protein [Candidatus Acidoferrales bacterium]
MTVTENESLNAAAAALTALLVRGLQALFGPGVNTPVIGAITWADLGAVLGFVLVFLLANGLAAAFLRRKIRQSARDESKQLHHHVFGALGKPLYLLIWIFGVYVAATPLLLKLPPDEELQFVRGFFNKLADLGAFAALFWLFFRFTRVLDVRLAALAAKTGSKLDDLFVPLVGKSLRVIVPVVGIIFALPILNLPPDYAGVVAKGTSILLIVAVALILFQAVNLGEKAVLTKYDISTADNLQARKIYTQVHVISKTLYVIIGLFTVASILMLFEEMRRFGTSILASAGVVGVVLGFAAQKTIANLFAGFQLAMTQPIRLDDVVIVEGEWGRVEEITLTYVVIHIWDDRRLIVPLSYFIEKPFQNWTRQTADLLGSVFVWVDYTLPLDEARRVLKEIIENHPLWDRRFWNLQVTDATEKTMQIRVLATSADSSKSWDLRCDIREKFIAYLQKHYPQCLPRLRAEFGGAAPAA